MDRPIDLLLSVMSGVKETGPNKWVFSCPGPNHKRGDKSPSAFMRLTDYDKPPLLYCSMGCGYHEILGALGYKYADLMPDKADDKSRSYRPRIAPAEGMQLMTNSMYVMLLCAEQMRTGELSDSNRSDLYAAIRSAHIVAEMTGVKLA
jgi:hypothetical protein